MKIFFTNLTARLFSISILEILCYLYVVEYSTCDLTRVLCANSLTN